MEILVENTVRCLLSCDSRRAVVFSVEYQPLLGTHPVWAKIACLPWDEAIFGFR
jgi:hypothetical protein